MAGDIWLGDLATALALAAPGDRERRRTIAALLGFAPRGGGASREPGPDAAPAGLSPAREEETVAVREAPAAPAPADPAADAAGGPGAAGAAGPAAPVAAARLLTPVAVEPLPVRAWRAAALPVAGPVRRGTPPPYEPLLARRSSAAMVQTAVARVVDDGEPDIPRIVRRLARGHALARLPLRPVATLRFGAQILVDLGVGMEPFARDQGELVAQIRAVVGREHTRARYFEDSPLRGVGEEGRWSWGPYTPPTRGTRVLVLSDLGTGGPVAHPRRSGREEWAELTRRLGRAGCRVTAFVPCPPHRLPAWAAELMDIVPWDRHTTVGQVTRRLRTPDRY